MPQVDSTWGVSTREPQSDLDRSAFLNLLITQLRHQDPLNPMDDRDFIAQMAQFSTLEQMMNLNNTFERTQAFGMIGKIIDAEFFCPHAEEWVEIDGRFVTAVRRQGDTVFLVVMGEDGRPIDVPFDAVFNVSEDFFVTQQLFDIFSNVNAQRATELIGRYVQAISYNGERATFIEGRVDSVKFAENGAQAVLVIGNREVFLNEVFSVADEPLLIGSEHFTHGTVAGVDIRNNRAYLIFDNPPTLAEGRVHVRRINHATEALAFVGSHMNHGSIEGHVQSVTIRGGIPFLNVYSEPTGGTRRGQIDFLEFLVDRAEGNASSTTPGVYEVHPTNSMLRNSNYFVDGDGNARSVTSVETRNNRVYIVFNNNTAGRVQVSNIAHVVTANEYARVQEQITYEGVTGYVRYLELRGGIPFLVVFDEYCADRENGTEIARINLNALIHYRNVGNAPDDSPPVDGDDA
jgi:flagellar basal-body rod modification protein FlgD